MDKVRVSEWTSHPFDTWETTSDMHLHNDEARRVNAYIEALETKLGECEEA